MIYFLTQVNGLVIISMERLVLTVHLCLQVDSLEANDEIYLEFYKMKKTYMEIIFNK